MKRRQSITPSLKSSAPFIWSKLAPIRLLDSDDFRRFTYKTPKNPPKKLGYLRYVTFASSLILVIGLFFFKTANIERVMFYLFLGGNLLYYIVGIILARSLKDNRAFCKYVCPVALFLKPASYFSILRIRCDESERYKVRKALKGASDERRGKQRRPKKKKWNGMHLALRMRQEASGKSAEIGGASRYRLSAYSCFK